MVVHPLIPAAWEAEMGGSQSEASSGKSRGPYLKNKLKAKGLGEGAQKEALRSTPSTSKQKTT
jgi:hypothetical protein